MWNPRATTCGHSSVLDWWGSKQNESFSKPLLVLCRTFIPSTNLIAPLHILHWRLICTSVQNISLGWICVDRRSSGHFIFCVLALGLQTSTSVHIWACKLHIHSAQCAHHAYMCSLRTFVHKYSLYNAWTACSCCYFWPRLYSITNILLKICLNCFFCCSVESLDSSNGDHVTHSLIHSLVDWSIYDFGT